MAVHTLTKQFQAFFGRLNPSPSFTSRAASEHATITSLLTSATGPASALAPRCFLQGSYKQQTAIYAINDVDLVALCRAKQGLEGYLFSSRARALRDDIFATLGSALESDARYRGKVRYGTKSMCVKVDLGIRVEILPAIYPALADYDTEPIREPFLLFRPRTSQWERGFARKHQAHLAHKNAAERTDGNFIPAIKVFKHLRSYHGLDVVSFHLECLLYSLPNRLFRGAPADYLGALVHEIAAMSPRSWFRQSLWTPCGDRNICTPAEWSAESWETFHNHMASLDHILHAARTTASKKLAIEAWQLALGKDYFPAEVAS